MSDVITNDKYFDCDCEKDFIKKVSDRFCPVCKVVYELDDPPNSRQNEIDEMYQKMAVKCYFSVPSVQIEIKKLAEQFERDDMGKKG